MLGPATVALAIPIYKQFRVIQKEALSISISLIAGSLFAIVSTFILCEIFKIEDQDRKSTRLNSSHSQQSRMPSSA